MKTIRTLGMLAGMTLLSSLPLFAQTSLSPTVNFTLRDSGPLDGVADLMDATPDGGWFDGFLTVNDSFHEDRVFVEFNLAQVPSFWNSNSISLHFSTKVLGPLTPSTIRLSYYTGNGVADFSDWTIPTTTVALIPANAGQAFSTDVTSLVNSFGGSGFLGLRFDLVDPNSNQKILNASSIILTVPEPGSLLLGLVGLGLTLCRKRSRSSRQ